MSDEQHTRLEGKLDTVMSNVQQIQIDVATVKTSHEGRISALEAFRDNFTKIVIGVLIAVIGGLLLVIMKGGLKF